MFRVLDIYNFDTRRLKDHDLLNKKTNKLETLQRTRNISSKW